MNEHCSKCAHYEVCKFYEVLGVKVLSLECGFFENKIDTRKIRAEAINEFAVRLTRYYEHLTGQTPTPAIVYHIDQIANDLLKKGTTDESTSNN